MVISTRMGGTSLRVVPVGLIRYGSVNRYLRSDAVSDQLTRVFTPKSRPNRFEWTGFSPRSYVDLLRALVSAQVKVRYRNSALGFGWAVLNPLIQMLVYSFVFGSIFGSGDRANFRLYLLAGLLPWQAFSSGLTTSVKSLVVGRDLLKKAPFPSETLPLASALTALVNSLIIMVVLFVFLIVGDFPVLANLHWVFIALAIEVVFLCGLSLLLAPLNVYFRDVEHFVLFLVWIWFFLTPVVYPLSKLEAFQAKVILALNPMAVVVTTIQNALLRGQPPGWEPLATAGGLSLGVLALGWWVFKKLQYELPKAL